MKTRKQYLAGECSFDEYYGQFVSDRDRSILLSVIGEATLKKAYDEDHNFNTISLSTWDRMTPSKVPFTVAEKIRESGDYPTLCGLVCILKAAAKQIVKA